MPKINFIEPGGETRTVEAMAGQTMMEAATAANIDMEAACEGAMACSTCHVVVAEDWFDRLDAPSEDEEDMLDLASELTPTSRLACQIVVTEALDGLTVRLPNRTNNLMLV